MKKNWKTIFGKCIYQHPNNDIKVFDNYFYRWLTFSNPFIQTLISKTKPHESQLQYIHPLTLATRDNLGDTCILGLGGGGLVHFLQNANINITAVEVNKEVIEIANKYFFLKNNGPLSKPSCRGKLRGDSEHRTEVSTQVHEDSSTESTQQVASAAGVGKRSNAHTKIVHKDGYDFVKATPDKYQNLLIDIHDCSSFPKNCLNPEFFNNCVNTLKDDGVLGINITNNTDREIIFSHLYKLFTTKIIHIPIQGYANVILLASNKFNTTYVLNNIQQNQEVKQIVWDNEFGYILDYKN